MQCVEVNIKRTDPGVSMWIDMLISYLLHKDVDKMSRTFNNMDMLLRSDDLA